MRQYETVILALEQLGGYGTLGELYQKALAMPEVKHKGKTAGGKERSRYGG